MILKVFVKKFIRRAEIRWNERKTHMVGQEDSNPIQYRRETSNLLLNWKMIWGQNAVFSWCKKHNTLVTHEHLSSSNGIQQVPDLSETLKNGFILL